MSEENLLRRKRAFVIYLILALGITWVAWIPSLIIADQQGYLLPTINNLPQLLESGGIQNSHHLFLSISFSFAVYGPLIAGLVATALEKGKNGVDDLLGRLLKWRVEFKWYAIALGVALTIPLVPRLIAAVSGQIDKESGGITWSLPLLVAIFVWQTLTSGLGEEPGWRGFLLPHLQSRFNPDRAIWVLGVIWAVWHYPFTIFDTITKAGDIQTMGLVITILLSLAGQTLSLIGMSYLYAWMYNNTKSVLLVILFHGLSNFLPAVILARVSSALFLIIALMPWVLVFVLERVYDKDQFPGG